MGFQVISKIFDKGNKGYLTEQEKKQVRKAIENGIEKKFVWNVEQAGNQRVYRLLQKRGKIIDSEDFMGIQDTYPEYPKQNLVTLDPNGKKELRNTKNGK